MKSWDKRKSPPICIEVMSYINPVLVVLQLITREGQKFGIALDEVRHVHSNTAQLSSAYRREVSRVGEDHHPSGNRSIPWII